METQYEPKANTDQGLRPIQLQLDPLSEMADIDARIKARRSGTRPGLHRLLTVRRDCMAALAAELAPIDR